MNYSQVKDLLAINRLQNIFQGNNGYLASYSKSIGDEGYADIESAVKDKLEYRKQELGRDELEEIYRIQVGEKVFIYLKEAESVVELEFFWQDNLYYYLGSKTLIYTGMGSSDGYTLDETIRKDIANTMWRGVGYEEVGAPTWGVSDNEQIFAMTINSEKMDNVVQIDEKSGKTYYFWIISNIGEIKTIDDKRALLFKVLVMKHAERVGWVRTIVKNNIKILYYDKKVLTNVRCKCMIKYIKYIEVKHIETMNKSGNLNLCLRI